MKKILFLLLIVYNIIIHANPYYAAIDYINLLPEEESQFIISYLQSFPYNSYKIYSVTDVGYVYIDKINDGIKNVIRKGSQWEPKIMRLLKKHIQPHSIALDIGAHIGLHTLYMSKCVQENGTVLAFEPQKKLYRELIMNLDLNKTKNIQAYRFALGNDEKMVQMNPSVLRNEGGTSIGTGGDDVQLTKLDLFNLNDISLIKIDVEGFENEVLDGARETILRNRPVIIIEIMGGHDYRTASPEIKQRINITKAKLIDLGYKVTRVTVHDYLAIPFH